MGWEGTAQVDAFAADLRALPEHARGDGRQVLAKAGVNIKQQLQAEMSASEHFGQVSTAISYEIEERAGSIELVVGPTKGSPGSLANVAYFGTSRGGGTVPDPRGALDAEAPVASAYLLDLVAKHL